MHFRLNSSGRHLSPEQMAQWLEAEGRPDVASAVLYRRVDSRVWSLLGKRGFAALNVGDAVDLAFLQSRFEVVRHWRQFKGSVGVLHRIPVVNLFWDIAIDEVPPDLDNLSTGLQTLSLLCALLLTVCMNFPGQFTFDELELIRERFDFTPAYGAFGTGAEVIADFAWTNALASCFSGAGLLVSVSFNFFTPIMIEGRAEEPDVSRRWWCWVRWIPLAAFFLTLAATVFCFMCAGAGGVPLLHVHTPPIDMRRSPPTQGVQSDGIAENARLCCGGGEPQGLLLVAGKHLWLL